MAQLVEHSPQLTLIELQREIPAAVVPVVFQHCGDLRVSLQWPT